MRGLSVVILGAGAGVRMNSAISKPLHKIGNLEMVNHVIKTAQSLDVEEIIVVVSNDNKIQMEVAIGNIETVIQSAKNGTADAARTGFTKIKHKDNDILIMFGDVPLIKKETYEAMLSKLDDSCAAAILAFHTSDIKKKYGRLMLNDKGELERIVEYKDASETERNNNLCNAGIFLVRGNLLEGFLGEINNNNASNEYYLTDIVSVAKKHGYGVNFSLAEENEVMGINSREELAAAEAAFQRNKRKEFMANGVTLVDPESVYFSHDTEIGNDVVVEPNVVFLPRVKVQNNVQIKAFSYLEGCEIKSGAVVGPFARIKPNTIIEN
ncbi:MAG: NTP transferase domain-containing protein [Rickettsiales bacterium]|jgi:bifunctional UDP-N-acetylglucosamine pyrophosphorylase/glucosamine-1-phosphate N-acetyltransferase|nr:NTP transferase domain-containing protein [Rickettsiales bacterium]